MNIEIGLKESKAVPLKMRKKKGEPHKNQYFLFYLEIGSKESMISNSFHNKTIFKFVN
jgi:hypothetical protein